ncbi:MAG TPA: hypothetical protein VLX28_17245 [Thermoanaerobaculia bacterium]|nr:hypothetical protein [Thermoanaerobaculia bacterium]
MPSSQGRSLAQRRGRWNLIILSRKAIAEKLPNLVEDLDDLESVDKEIGTLSAKQAYYLAKVRETTRQLRTLSQRGDRLRGRIGASLRGRHGFDSLELIRYGFTPRRHNKPLEESSGPVDPREEFPGEKKAE